MKSLFVTLFYFIALHAVHGQQRYSIEQGKISFTSNAELEVIKAASEVMQGLLDPTSNKFVFSVSIKTFKGFNSALQREHFNEKYLESDRFPKATFSGKIIEELDFSKDGTYDVRAKGELDIHGLKQTRIIKSKLTISGGKLTIESKFGLPLSDHNIVIPTIVNQKIATEIEVIFSVSMILK
jgi:hypothetical protein